MLGRRPQAGSAAECLSSMEEKRSILSRFWRGDCSLALSFWVFYVGLTIVVQAALPLTRGIIEGRTFDPTRIFADVLVGFVLLSALGLYQWVGLWRAAHRAVARERASGRHSLPGWSVRVVVVLAVANFGRVVVTDVAPSARELYEIAFRDDPSVPPFVVRATSDGTQLLVSGGFKYGLTDRFLKQARALPALRIVHLASIGGRLGEALHLAREIGARGLDTYVSDGCYSACTVAYAAGRQRFIRDGAELGYHAESFLGAALADDSESAALLRAGVASAFVARAMATPPQRMWKPTIAELTAAKAITAVVPPERFAGGEDLVAPKSAPGSSCAARRKGVCSDAPAVAPPAIEKGPDP